MASLGHNELINTVYKTKIFTYTKNFLLSLLYHNFIGPVKISLSMGKEMTISFKTTNDDPMTIYP